MSYTALVYKYSMTLAILKTVALSAIYRLKERLKSRAKKESRLKRRLRVVP